MTAFKIFSKNSMLMGKFILLIGGMYAGAVILHGNDN